MHANTPVADLTVTKLSPPNVPPQAPTSHEEVVCVKFLYRLTTYGTEVSGGLQLDKVLVGV